MSFLFFFFFRSEREFLGPVIFQPFLHIAPRLSLSLSLLTSTIIGGMACPRKIQQPRIGNWPLSSFRMHIAPKAYLRE